MRNENIHQSIMPAVYIIADNIYSPLGTTTAQNFERIKQGISGIQKHHNKAVSDTDFHASLFNYNENEKFKELLNTKFEQLLIVSVEEALRNTDVDITSDKTI